MVSLIILSLASFGISFLVVFLIKQRFSQALLDIPNDRSSHTQPTPRGGGLGFVIAFALTSLFACGLSEIGDRNLAAFSDLLSLVNLSSLDLSGISDISSTTNFPSLQDMAMIWLVLTPLAIVGMIDDRYHLPARIRYLVQATVATIAVIYFGVFPQPWAQNLAAIAGIDLGHVITFALTVIGITAMINFYNFMDGLDGLVAGVTVVQLGFLAIYLHQPIFWLLVAALLGFLWWNWSPAQIFMGDVGSTVLGAGVAIALLSANSMSVNSVSITSINIANASEIDVTMAWSAFSVTLPLIGDAIYTLCRRLMRGENIFQAHRSHIYQRLQLSGWSHSQVAIVYILLTLAIAIGVYTFGAIASGIAILLVAMSIWSSELYLQKFASQTALK